MKGDTAMVFAAPLVVFGLLYLLVVQPERGAAFESHNQLEIARSELGRRRATDTSGSDTHGRGIVDALTAALNDPSVGGVSNAAISRSGSNAADTRVTLTFDARYEQIGRFLWNARALPATLDLQSVEVAPEVKSGSGLLRTKMTFHIDGPHARPRPSAPAAINAGVPPEWVRDPFAKDVQAVTASKKVALPAAPAGPDPVVTSILFSEGHRVARVDGRIVGPGDRLGQGVVQSIEPEALVLVEPDGRTRRLQIARPLIGTVPR